MINSNASVGHFRIRDTIMENHANDFSIESPNNQFRYWLNRSVQYPPSVTPSLPEYGKVIFVMLNPSTARGDRRDPTDRKCEGFARRMGAATYGIVNLYSASTAYPKELFEFGPDEAIGPHGDEYLVAAFQLALKNRWPVIAAWGSPSLNAVQRDQVWQRALEVESAYQARRHHLQPRGVPMFCLARTQDKKGRNWPRHPLMLAYGGPVLPYECRPRRPLTSV